MLCYFVSLLYRVREWKCKRQRLHQQRYREQLNITSGRFIGIEGRVASPSGPKFLTCSFGENWSNSMLAPPPSLGGFAPPPLGNPESATDEILFSFAFFNSRCELCELLLYLIQYLFFVFNTNLAFLCNIDTKGFKKLKN